MKTLSKKFPRIKTNIKNPSELERMFLAWKMFDRLSYFTCGFLPQQINNKIRYFKFLSGNGISDIYDHYIDFIDEKCIGEMTNHGAMLVAEILMEDLATFHPELEKFVFLTKVTAKLLRILFSQ